MPSKTCSKCKQVKPTSFFGPSKRARDGFASACNPCCIAAAKPWREANRARIAAATKAWQKANPDRMKVRKDRWRNIPENAKRERDARVEFRRANAEMLAVRMAAWRIAHPGREEASRARHRQSERFKITTAAWREANKRRLADKENRRRTRLRGGTLHKFTMAQLNARMSVFGDVCAYCHASEWKHMDHVKPLALGGPHCLSNLRPACAHCNLSKHAQEPKHWLSRTRPSSPLPLP
jgi:5-methylcytosine-specific restriction endonuclease McrA